MSEIKTQYRHKTCGSVMTLSPEVAAHHAEHPEKVIGARCDACPPMPPCGQHWPKDQFEWLDGSPFCCGGSEA